MILVAVLLSACVRTPSSGIDVLCSVPLPTVSQADTTLTVIEVDNFSEKFRAACGR